MGASSASTAAAEKLISIEKYAFPLYWVLIVAPPLHTIVRMRRGGEKQKRQKKKKERSEAQRGDTWEMEGINTG